MAIKSWLDFTKTTKYARTFAAGKECPLFGCLVLSCHSDEHHARSGECMVMFEGYDTHEMVNFGDIEPYEVRS